MNEEFQSESSIDTDGMILFGENRNDQNLIEKLLQWMNNKKCDFTNTFCFLMKKDIDRIDFFKDPDFVDWHKKWNDRLKQNNKTFNESIALMQENNPQVIPRNHLVEKSLNSASKNMNLDIFLNFLRVLKKPYTNQKNITDYQFVKKTTSQDYKTYCGT